MKKDELSDMKRSLHAADLGGHGHVGMKKKDKAADSSNNHDKEHLEEESHVQGRLARRHTLPHIGYEAGRRGHRQSSGSDGPSIFDDLGDEGGLEALLFTASRAFQHVSRDLSLSPFSRIRNDLEQFVEESDRDLEERFLAGGPRTPMLRNMIVTGGGSHPGSPLVGPPVSDGSAEGRTVWVGGLERGVEEETIRSAFSVYGEIVSVKSLDGYAFIRYNRVAEASAAIAGMNGQVLGHTVIRTGLGRDEVPSSSDSSSLMGVRSVWVGNLPADAEERTLSRAFAPYGAIESIRLVPTKHCAFVNFCRAEQAAAAVAELDGRLRIGEETVRVGYAKQALPSAAAAAPVNVPLRRLSTGSVGLPNPARIDLSLPGEHVATSLESLRTIFGALEVSSGRSSEHIVNPVRSAVSTEQADPEAFCWEIPELPAPYFGPELTPGRIRDYRRYVESQSCKPSEFDLIAMEVIPVAVAASTDPVGNVLVQKLIERGSEDLKSMIIAELAPYMAAVGVHKNGTWVIQKLINWCTLPQHQEQVAELLRPYLVPLLQDQYGNYVIQCCLQFDSGRNNFIMEGLGAQCIRIATSRFGARAMRSCLESPHTTARQQKQVAQAIIENAGRLLLDPNGVIVMQWLLDSDLPTKHALMLKVLEPVLASLVGLRFASNLVAKILSQTAEPEARDRLLELLVRDPESPASPIQNMLKEPTCIQIIAKVLGTAPSHHRTALIDALRIAVPIMMQAPAAPSHIGKLQAELKDPKRSQQGLIDLAHTISSGQSFGSEASSTTSATPSPQPVIISSKLKAHVQAGNGHDQHLVFGTSHHLGFPASSAGPKVEPRASNTQNQS